MTHLDALELRLSNERMRLTAATSDQEKALRTVWVSGIEKEIADEYKFLGIEPPAAMTDDELLAELGF